MSDTTLPAVPPTASVRFVPAGRRRSFLLPHLSLDGPLTAGDTVVVTEGEHESIGTVVAEADGGRRSARRRVAGRRLLMRRSSQHDRGRDQAAPATAQGAGGLRVLSAEDPRAGARHEADPRRACLRRIQAAVPLHSRASRSTSANSSAISLPASTCASRCGRSASATRHECSADTVRAVVRSAAPRG